MVALPLIGILEWCVVDAWDPPAFRPEQIDPTSRKLPERSGLGFTAALEVRPHSAVDAGALLAASANLMLGIGERGASAFPRPFDDQIFVVFQPYVSFTCQSPKHGI